MTSRYARFLLVPALLVLSLGACKKGSQLPHKQEPKAEPIEFEAAVSGVSRTMLAMPQLPEGQGALRVVVKNRVEGVTLDVTQKTRLLFTKIGAPTQKPVEHWASREIRLPEGSYRVEVLYELTGLVRVRGVLKKLRVHGRVEQRLEVQISCRYDTVSFALTNLKVPVASRSVIQIFRAGDLDRPNAKPLVQQPGGSPLVLPAGTYDVRLIYRERDGLSTSKSITDFIVRGELKAITRAVDFEFSVGLLHVKVTNRGQDVTKKCKLAVYRLDALGADGRPTGAPVWKGAAAEVTTLPAGSYAVLVHYQEPDGELLKDEKWLKPVVIRGRYQREEPVVQFDLSWGEVEFRVLDGTLDVNEHTRVFVFRAKEPERALDHERGGKSLKLLVGVYDFKAVYVPANAEPDRRKVLWRREVRVKPGAKSTVDFQFAPPGLPGTSPSPGPGLGPTTRPTSTPTKGPGQPTVPLRAPEPSKEPPKPKVPAPPTVKLPEK